MKKNMLNIINMEPTTPSEVIPETSSKKPLIIGIAVGSILILIVSLILYFTASSSNSSSVTVTSTSESDTYSSLEDQISQSYLEDFSTFSEMIASDSSILSDDQMEELEKFVTFGIEPDDLLAICLALGICDTDKTELTEDEKTSIQTWIIDDTYFGCALGTELAICASKAGQTETDYCANNFHRECFLTNGSQDHGTASTWVDNRSSECTSPPHCSSTLQGYIDVSLSTGSSRSLVIESNNIPAHDIGFTSCESDSNMTGIPCNFASNNGYGPTEGQNFTVPVPPSLLADRIATSYTELSQTRDDAIMLDGVVVDIFSGGCYDPHLPSDDDLYDCSHSNATEITTSSDCVSYGGTWTGTEDTGTCDICIMSRLSDDPDPVTGNKKVGCMNEDMLGISSEDYYLLDPAFPENKFAVDDNNAHTQTGGHYHYHANPYPERGEVDADEEPEVIGFAADGHPIYELWAGATSCYRISPLYQDENGTETGTPRQPLYSGDLTIPPIPPIDDAHPLGMYIQDYLYYEDGTCNLDEGNGMIRNGHYGYYVTSDYPYIIRKFRDDPHSSFCKDNYEDSSGECGSSSSGSIDCSGDWCDDLDSSSETSGGSSSESSSESSTDSSTHVSGGG